MTDRRIPTAKLGARLIAYRKGRYAANVVLWGIMWMLPIVVGLLVRAFFDVITDGAEAGLTVTTIVTLIVVYGFVRISVMLIAMWNDVQLTFRIGTLLRRNVLERIFELPGAQAMSESPGEAISTFRDDVDENVESFSWTVDMIGLAVFGVVALSILISINGRFTLFVFGPTLIVVYLAALLRRKIKRYREAAREATGHITEALGETFASVQSIKVAGAEQSMIAHFRKLNDHRRGQMVNDATLTAVLESLFWNTINIGTGIVLIVGAAAMSAGEFTVGEFALFVFFLDLIADVAFFLGMFIARYQQATVSFGRMLDLMGDTDPMRLVKHQALGLRGDLAEPEVVPPHMAPLERLEVRNLSFRYPGTGEGIHDVSFVVPAGSFTVITGRVGAGKTTLLRAILGLVQTDSGEILWNGEVVNDPASFFIPPRSAYTPQVPRLFSMSLIDNLLMGRRDPEEIVDEAVRSAVMSTDVAGMPEGLSTMVGPLGVRLSGGQVQRSATARMFVRRPDLLVFDDVSSALDVETERQLWEMLFRDRRGVTSLVVSHRHPALQRADQIVVMESGRVAAVGKLDGLLETSPEFRAMWEAEE